MAPVCSGFVGRGCVVYLSLRFRQGQDEFSMARRKMSPLAFMTKSGLVESLLNLIFKKHFQSVTFILNVYVTASSATLFWK